VFQGNSNLLRLFYFDVGQGDSILLRTPYNQDILIDGGPDSSVLSKLGRALPFYDHDIELLIITHPHPDHYQGVFDVLKRYKVDKILISTDEGSNKGYRQLLEQIKSRAIPLQIINQATRVNLGDYLTFDILFPDHSVKETEKENNMSVVGRLVFYNQTFLFTGDSEQEREGYLISKKAKLNSDVLKVGHHGSSTATSEEWLKAAAPKIAIISVSAHNTYGHPSLRVLRRLERQGIKIYRTDENGDIKITTDGETLKVKTAK
jgi:competence protein ComEC